MMYNTIFAKSFSSYEQKRLGYGALVGCLLIVLSLCTVFKPYLGPIQDLNLKLHVNVDTKMSMLNDTSSSAQIAKGKDTQNLSKVNISGASSNQRLHLQFSHMDYFCPKKSKDIVAEILVNHTNSSPQMNGAESAASKNLVNDTRSSPQIAKFEDDVTKVPINDTSSSPPIAEAEQIETKELEPVCFSEQRTEFCQTTGDIRVHGKSSSVYIVSPKATILPENTSWTIRPYARKEDASALIRVRQWSIKPVKVSQEFPQCTQYHSIPAVIFSTGGYVGNHFHEFTDIIIPLFLTSRQFNGEVKFIVTDMRPWWISKYRAILNKLSKYEVMNIDKDDEVHCFPSVNVGLKRYHKELSIDPQKYSYSMKDFRDFLRSSYSLKRVKAMKMREGERKKPRLLILARRRSRSFTNTAQIEKMAKSMGFEVIIMEAGGSMPSFAEVVNSCDVLLGVHGAGLTNILFLPENAVFIQVVPYGGLDWLAKYDFGLPSRAMGLEYLEYKIRVEESTLIQQYPLDHMIIKDPPSIGKIGWEAFKSTYLDQQNVMLNVNRFRPTLQKALELLHQ